VLAAVLDRFLADADGAALAAADPVELVRRFDDPDDQEVVGLIVAALAYGRVASIKAKAGALLHAIGGSPAVAVDSGQAAKAARGFVYRFQRGDDLPRFLRAVRTVRRRHGSLAAAMAGHIDDAPDYADALDRWVLELRDAFASSMSYGERYLLPRSGATNGAAKRLWLYLRWMIRPAGAQDLGTWDRLVPDTFTPSKLIIPLDTHILRIGGYIGLTNRRSGGLATAREITAALRRLRPADPLYYDMALCHLGISGACPRKRDVEKCRDCPIRGACRLGRTPRGWREVTESRTQA